MTLQRPILWIHEESLGAKNPALQAWPEAPAVFVFDTQWIQDAKISRKRLGFLYENALDLPLTLRKGDVAAEVLAFARRHQADGVVSSSAVDPRLERIGETIDAELPLDLLDPEAFVELPRPPRLGRFSRYWREAEAVVWEGYFPATNPSAAAGPASIPQRDW